MQHCLCPALVVVVFLAGSRPAKADSPDYLKTVRAYADAMIEHGRDTYGEVRSPLFAASLDRKTLKLPGGGAAPRVPGVRSGDRTLTGANPMHDQDLYQVLYALAKITGQKRYAAEADKALTWFFEHCQSPATGLMAWGEHLGWDFHSEKPVGDTHEYFRPWVLWDRSFKLAPQPCTRFARGVWDHQIGDRKTGNFSRHAKYSGHGPGTNSQYPRHGGFYIATWAHAYQRTPIPSRREPVFLRAIETVLGHFDSRRNPNSGAIPCESASRSREKMIWPESNLSLAIDLWDGAQRVPEPLATKMRRSASKTDQVYLRIAHDLSRDGYGFVSSADADTLRANLGGGWPPTQTWATRYGASTDARDAMMCYCRYKQVKLEGYKRLILAAAERYLHSDPDPSAVVWPGAVGDAIALLVEVYRMTGERRYLARADVLSAKAVAVFFTDGCPLPKASSQHDHYEAITRADTLVMALLNLWAAKNKPELDLGLVWPER